MRSVLSLQPQLGATDIGDIQLNPQSRDDIRAVLKGLQCVYCDPARRAELFALLERHVQPGTDRSVGRPGRDLWQVLIMGILKQSINCDFDRLQELVNNPIQVRQMLGLGAAGFDSGRFGLQTVIDTVALLSAALLEQGNRVLVAAGHELAGGQPGASLAGRCDSFEVHRVRDGVLREDQCRARKGHLPRVLAALSNVALSILRMLGKTNIAEAREELSYSPRAALALALR